MKLNKGLFRDISLEEQPDGTWVGGKNLIFSNKYSELRNEPGFSKLIEGDENSKVIGIISTSTEFIIFKSLTTLDLINSEIGIYRDGEYITILIANLNFNINYPIFGESYYNYKGELIVLWSDNHNKPKICNLDNLPIVISPDKNIVDLEEIHKLDLFSSFKQPRFKLTDVIESGGNLPSGAYYLTIQYELADNSYGNFLNISNPITIIQDSGSINFFTIGGCEDNLPTSKAIKIQITNLDDRYNKFRFGIIHKTIASTQCYVTNYYNIAQYSNTYIIPSLSGLSTINLSDILVKSTYYDKINAITNIDNILWIANTQVTEELKYQKYANNIKINYVYDTLVSLNGFKGSHKDAVMLFNKKGFMPGEVYAFYIRFVYKGGNKVTPAFHIPGRSANSGDLDAGTTVAKSIYPNAKHFHFEDTCNDSGMMSYWENINERYPNDPEFDGTKDYNDNIILDDARDLTGSPVKHHKFPSSRYLNNNFGMLTSLAGTSIPVNNALTSPKILTIGNTQHHKKLVFDSFDNINITGYNNNTKIQNDGDTSIVVTLNIQISGSATFFVVGQHGLVQIPGTVNFTIWKNDSESINSIAGTGPDGTIPNTTYGIGTVVFNIVSMPGILPPITLEPGEYLHFDLTAIASISNGITTLVVSPASTIIFNLNQASELAYDGTLAGKVLGIRLDNIAIPDYIVKYCESFEILYAQRDNNNLTVLSQGMLSRSLQRSSDIIKYDRYYDFDLTSLHKSFQATHIQFDGYIQNNIYNEDTNNIEVLPSGSNKYAKIISSQHLLNNAKYEVVDNLYKEKSIHVDINPLHIPTKVNTSTIYNNITIHGVNNQILTTLCVFKEDIYLNFSSQNLVNCGVVQNIYNAGYFNNVKINSGDVTISLFGLTRHLKYRDVDNNYDNFLMCYNLFPIYSVLNPGLRFKGLQINETFFPAFNFIQNKIGLGTSIIGRNLGGNDSLWELIQAKFEYDMIHEMPEYYSNNLIYSTLNNIEPVIPYNYKSNFTDKFPYRIHKSVKQLEEAKTQNWRVFKPNEYYESISNRGEIVALSSDGSDLLILHRNSLLVARNITSLQISESVVSTLGNAELFNTRPIEILYNGVGYVGCQSKFAVVRFKYGILIIDKFSKKIFIYNNLKVDEISIYGVQELLTNILDYDEEILNTYSYYFDDGEIVRFDDGQTVDYRNATLSEKLTLDNPFTQFGIHATWDDENSRLLITKVGTTDLPLSNEAFTLSYYPEAKLWGWLHDYIPKFSFYNRNGFYILDSLGSIYKGNNKTLPNDTVGSDEVYGYLDSYIDVVFNNPPHLDKLFQSLEWVTKYYENDKELRDVTFSKIEVFNNLRYGGLIPIINDTKLSGFNTRNVTGVWRFNELRDILKNKDTKIVDMSNINILDISHLETDPEEEQYLEDWVTDWYDKNLMIDTFIIVRLHFNRIEDPINTDTKVLFKIFNIGANSNIIKR